MKKMVSTSQDSGVQHMKQIVVHCEEGLTSAALLEEGQLAEYYVERPCDKIRVGDIYMGKVVNILPGMGAAFVDIGYSKNAFLYIDDLLPANLEKQPKVKPSIHQLLQEGQEIMVQISKEPVGTKGARVTIHFSLPGRWIVYMPHADYIGVSRKVESDGERARLKHIAEQLKNPGEGLIIRTVAEGESLEALQGDLNFLRDLWNRISEQSAKVKAPESLYRDLGLIPRLVRDVFTDEVDELIIDNAGERKLITELTQAMTPNIAGRIKVYSEAPPIFHSYGVHEELEKAYQARIWLKNGGYLHIDQTEALTVIDVNTGKYIGSVNLEQTVFETNLEAAEQIARLIRLRDIGGIVIVDFIDMNREEHRQRIIERLELLTKRDRTKSQIVGWTQLGLLEMTRKKVRNNMDALFFKPCPACGGSGKIHIHETE